MEKKVFSVQKARTFDKSPHTCFMKWNDDLMKWEFKDSECKNHPNNIVGYSVTKEMNDKYKPKRNFLQKIKHWFYLRKIKVFTNPFLGEKFEQ